MLVFVYVIEKTAWSDLISSFASKLLRIVLKTPILGSFPQGRQDLMILPWGKHYKLILIPANCQRRIDWFLISCFLLCNSCGLLVLSTSLIRKTPPKTSKKVNHPFQQYFLFRLSLSRKTLVHYRKYTVWVHGKIFCNEQPTLNYFSKFYCVYLLKCAIVCDFQNV